MSYQSAGIAEDTAEDEVSRYTITSKNKVLRMGILLMPFREYDVGVYLRAGLTRWDTELQIEETIIGLGVNTNDKDSISDSGTGYYYAMGYYWSMDNGFGAGLELARQNSDKLFQNSSKPFDLQQTSLAITLGYAF